MSKAYYGMPWECENCKEVFSLGKGHMCGQTEAMAKEKMETEINALAEKIFVSICSTADEIYEHQYGWCYREAEKFIQAREARGK